MKKTLLLLTLLLFLIPYTVNGKDNTMIYIDYPQVNEEKTNTLKIQGWYLTTESNTKLEVYVDEEKIEGIERVERKGIFDIIKDYGDSSTNEKPGYYKEINIENYNYGNHTLKIKVLDKDNQIIKTEERVFRKAEPKTMIYIDYPQINEEKENTLKIQGWYLTTGYNTKLEIYVDNEKQEGIERVERKGIFDIIKDYGDSSTNEKPGYYKEINIENYNYGNHTLKINVLDKDNQVIKTEERIFIKTKPKTMIYIDNPKVNEEKENTLKIQGWYLTTGYNTKLEIYVDNEKQEEIERVERKGIFDIIKDYGDSSTNEKPGYYKEINIKNYSYGNHTLKINVLDKDNQVIKTEERVFRKAEPKTIITIDYPLSKNDNKIIKIQGWYLANTEEVSIEILLDNTNIENYTKQERNDVYSVYKDSYGYDTKYPGYYTEYDGTTLKDGKHKLTINIRSTRNNQLLNTKTKEFELTKVKGILNIDYLEQASKSVSYHFRGWEMSTDEGSYFKTFIDNNEIEINQNRIKRDDVLSVIKGYGTKTENELPGIDTSIDITNIPAGYHTIRIELYSKYNDKISIENRSIYIHSKDYYNSDNTLKRKYSIPYYNQYDNRWKNIVYGFSKFGPRGCAPTSMAMAFTEILGREILPNNIADYLYNNTREFNKDTKGTSGLGIIYATNNYHIKRTGINSKEELDNALQDGKIVFAAMGPGTYGTPLWNHAIILNDYNNGMTHSYDPLYPSKNIWIDTSTIWSQKSTDPDDYRGGSVFYGLESYS